MIWEICLLHSCPGTTSLYINYILLAPLLPIIIVFHCLFWTTRLSLNWNWMWISKLIPSRSQYDLPTTSSHPTVGVVAVIFNHNLTPLPLTLVPLSRAHTDNQEETSSTSSENSPTSRKQKPPYASRKGAKSTQNVGKRQRSSSGYSSHNEETTFRWVGVIGGGVCIRFTAIHIIVVNITSHYPPTSTELTCGD